MRELPSDFWKKNTELDGPDYEIMDIPVTSFCTFVSHLLYGDMFIPTPHNRAMMIK